MGLRGATTWGHSRRREEDTATSQGQPSAALDKMHRTPRGKRSSLNGTQRHSGPTVCAPEPRGEPTEQRVGRGSPGAPDSRPVPPGPRSMEEPGTVTADEHRTLGKVAPRAQVGRRPRISPDVHECLHPRNEGGMKTPESGTPPAAFSGHNGETRTKVRRCVSPKTSRVRKPAECFPERFPEHLPSRETADGQTA